MRPGDHTAHAKTIINVAADGTVTGRTEESNTGALAMALRSAASNVQTLGSAVAARRVLQFLLTPGSGNFDLGNFAETSDPVSIKSSFTMDDRFTAPASGASAIIPRGMALSTWPGNFLLGTRLNGRKAAFVCYAGRQTEEIEATFESPMPPPLLLAPVTIDNSTFSYRSTMRVDGRTMKIHREFISRVERQVCPPDLEAKIAADLNNVRNNVFSAFAFGTSPPNAATRPAGIFAVVPSPAPTQNPLAQNPSEAPKPSSLSRYVDQVNMANARLANKQANSTGGKSPAPSNPAVAQNPPAAENPPARSAPDSQPVELLRFVASGRKMRLDFLYSIQPDCSSAGQTTVRILEKPQHGTLTVENGQEFTNFPKENQRYECNVRRSDGTVVFFDPEPEFFGKDSVALDVIYPLGQLSKRHYSIEVK
jgi:hypothetical protein